MAAPIRSMTGFARARRPLGEGEIMVSIKSLNHRGLDVHVHAPPAIDPFENLIRSAAKKKLIRGHVEVRVATPRTANSNGISLNRDMLASYIAAFAEAAKTHGIAAATPDLNAALRLPGMFADGGDRADDSAPETEAALLGALDDALDALNAFRQREGGELVALLRTHNARVAEAAIAMEEIRGRALPAFHARLQERLSDLLTGSATKGAAIEPQRLAQEAALLADRSDIGEEIARLRIHSGQLGGLLDSGGEVGKKLDFLLQEMNRETNTVLSKTSGIGEAGLRITEIALGAKADIEKIREQSLNLE
ncbi:MAG: YicC/YloC family endoribonuclease [Bryobacteraceae bacterium]